MIDIAGEKFGRLVAIEPVKQDTGGNWWWKCICDCGSMPIVKYTNLSRGTTKSCGCLAKELTSIRATKHGMSNTPTYHSWMCMKRRCIDSSAPNYANYGGRGIKVCSRWLNFENFLEDMGVRPEGMTLDRIDNEGNYTPENCRWESAVNQHRNTRANVILTYNGKTQCLAAWADEFGIRRNTFHKRIASGWSMHRALYTL